MQHKPVVGLYLDTRRAVKSGGYPVKIRITWELYQNGKPTWKPVYFHTKQFLTIDEFKVVQEGKAKGALKDKQAHIYKARAKAEAIIDKNNRITIDQFTAEYRGQISPSVDINSIFEEIITQKNAIDKVGTSNSYRDSLKSFTKFGGPVLLFTDIDKAWLLRYERYMTSKGKSLNTVAIYLRTLRAVFNRALQAGIISHQQYPFGRHGYQIRKKTVKKKAIPVDTKDKIVNYVPQNDSEAQALDFLLFSYYCNGMNFADMAHLRWENFRGDHFVFIRRKTKDTVLEQKEIQIPISPAIKVILQRRAIHKPYVFGIIDDRMDAVTRKTKIANWIHITNKWVQKIAKSLGYTERISTYSMRHTFTTALVNGGVPLTKVKDSLGHTSILTTQAYAEDLDLDTSKTFSSLL